MANAPGMDRPAEVLLVDDEENDVFLVREAFQRANTRTRVHTVMNGQQCLAFLRKEGAYGSAPAPTPDLILLDLNMPVMGGRETLAALAADPKLRHLPGHRSR